MPVASASPFRRGLSRLSAAWGAVVLAGSALAQSPPPDEIATYKKLSLAELMDVEVTSVSRRPEKLFGTASAIQVISDEDIRRAGATSLPEALRLATNLEVAQLDARQWAISARGFNNTLADKMLVLMDGRTLYTPLYAGVFWDVQDTLLEDLDRIEVISGPGATQWGANAVNGVINIRTKSAEATQGALAYAGLGNELQQFAGARYGGRAGSGVYYRVYAKYFDRDASRLPSGDPGGDAWRFGQTGFRVDWDSLLDDHFTVQGDAYVGHVAQLAYPDIGLAGANLLGRWTRSVGPDSDLTLQSYYDYTHRRIPGTGSEDLGTYDIDFQDRLRIQDRHEFLWGLSYRLIDDRVANSAMLAFLPPNVRRDWYSGFAQDEFALTPEVHVTLGAKLEHNPYTGMEIQPSLRGSWQMAPRALLWAAVSRAVRTPARIDRDFFAPGSPPYEILGGAAFRSEKLWAYEAGIRTQPADNLVISVSAFLNQYEDLRSLEPVTPGNIAVVTVGNGLRGASHGVETSLDYRITPSWRVHLGYTELRVRSWLNPGSHDQTSLGSVALDPNHQVQLRSQIDLPWHLEFDPTLRYVSRIPNQDVPGYAELDVHLGWRPTAQWEFSLVGQNLLHRRHVEFGTPPNQHAIERALYGKVTWRF